MRTQAILLPTGMIEHTVPFRWFPRIQRWLNLRQAGPGARNVHHCVCQQYAMADEASCPFCSDSGYVDADVFESLMDPGTGSDGIDWAEKVPEDEWEEHEERLRSVIDAQQEAEVLSTEVWINGKLR